MGYGTEVRELVGQLCDRYEVVVKTVEDDLGVGLVEMREISGLLDEVEKEVSANHLFFGDFDDTLSES